MIPFKPIFVGFAILFTGHALAVLHDSYYTIRWIDIPMHIIGGAWLAMLFFYFVPVNAFDHIHVRRFPRRLVVIIAVLSFVSFGGILWEFFEFTFDTFVADRNFMDHAQLGLRDTLSDLFFDLLGGLLAAFLILFSSHMRIDKKIRLNRPIEP